MPSADNVQFKPTLKWTIQIDQEADTIAGDLTYLASGFSWNANYRFIIDSEIDEAPVSYTHLTLPTSELV